MSDDNRIGPLLTIVASCLDCDRLRLDCNVYRCAHPKASIVAEPMICSAHREPRAPAWCPELPGARLAMARSVVGVAERNGASLCPRRKETWERMTPHHRLATADQSAPAVPFGPLRVGCDCGAPRGVTCADHYTGAAK